jgi:hypothetical protein
VRYFLIDNVQHRMAIDNQVYPIVTSALASNIAHIAYDVGSAQGGIEYSDRPSLTVPFTDPTPYQPYFNAWLTPAAAAKPAITVAAAQSIKQALLDSIYNSKRNSLTASYGGLLWSGSDVGLENIIAAATLALLGAPPPPPTPPPVFGVVSSVPNNTRIGLKTSVANVQVGASMLDLTSGTGPLTVTGVNVATQEVNLTTFYLTSIAILDTVEFTNPPPPPPPPVAGTVTPVNGQPQHYNASQLIALINAINAARTALQLTHDTLTANLAATVSVAAVIAFDATAGW